MIAFDIEGWCGACGEWRVLSFESAAPAGSFLTCEECACGEVT